MNDPLDRLRDAIDRVPVPDQWSAIEARAAAGDLAQPARRGVSRTMTAWMGAAAALLLIVVGVVAIVNREGDAPAAPPPGETIEPPSPSTVPPAVGAMPCTTSSELDAIAETVHTGIAHTDDPAWAPTGIMETDASTVVVADVAGVSRSGEFVRLDLRGTPTYLRGTDPVDAISWRTPQWGAQSGEEGPDPLADAVQLDGVRIIAAVVPLSSSPVWSPVFGGLVIGCAGSDVPAIDTHNMSRLRGEPSIDEIVQMINGEIPVPTSEPGADGTVGCTSDVDLDAVQQLLAIGVPVDDRDPANDIAELLARTDMAFRARLVSADRGADGSVVLHLADVQHLAGSQEQVVSVSVAAESSAQLERPVVFDRVEVVVFATRVAGLPTAWAPDPQGLFVACAGELSIVRPLLAPAGFLDHSSIGALAAQVEAYEPEGDPGPWGRPCTDRLGASEPPATDPVAEQPFGPLAPEPRLTVLYPMADPAPMYSAPVSSVSRVPGGLLIRLQSSGPEGGSRIVAVVNDDGSVRWRRCFSDMSGWWVVIDDGVAHLEMTPTGTNASEWWSFDLATGESSVDPGPPAELDESLNQSPPEVFFHVDGGGVSAPLSRRAPDGRELWRRDDLFDPGGEGFRTSPIQATASGEIVLVRACVGAPQGTTPLPDGQSCPYGLLGIDADDGTTLWQIDGLFGVSLVSDGYAIVTPSGTDLASVSELLDVATGEFVEGGISDEPGAFYEECCGGYDYNRVESSGALAWSIAFDHLNLWVPAGTSSQGGTVDLLGPAGAPIVSAHWGYPVDESPTCVAPSCRYVNAVGSGFTPGATVTASCWGDQEGEWRSFATFDLRVSADGSVAVNNLCWYGYKGTRAKVVIDGVESGAITN